MGGEATRGGKENERKSKRMRESEEEWERDIHAEGRGQREKGKGRGRGEKGVLAQRNGSRGSEELVHREKTSRRNTGSKRSRESGLVSFEVL